MSEPSRGNVKRWLLNYHGRPLAKPVNTDYRVAEPFTAWHLREVFRGPAWR